MSDLSYAKAVIDYNLSTQLMKKIKTDASKLTHVKIYIPNDDLLSSLNNKDDVKKAITELKAFAIKLGSIANIKLVKARYKLNGNYCVRLYYEDGLKLPMNPEAIHKDIDSFYNTYYNYFSAYNVVDEYVKKIQSRLTILSE